MSSRGPPHGADGAADLIEPGANGWVVPAGDVGALCEALQRRLDDREELATMRQAALRTAREHQWSDYRRMLSREVRSGLQSAGVAVGR